MELYYASDVEMNKKMHATPKTNMYPWDNYMKATQNKFKFFLLHSIEV